ncbi:hypothetical protein ALC56_11730, partial [Trachymyrmex septentrionalis]
TKYAYAVQLDATHAREVKNLVANSPDKDTYLTLKQALILNKQLIDGKTKEVNMVCDASSILSASNSETIVLPMATYYVIRNQMMFLKYVKYITTYRKCTFKTQTVIQMDKVTKIMVNNKYFPSKGIANDVGGIISAKSKKNTVNERRMEEHNDICEAIINTFSMVKI